MVSLNSHEKKWRTVKTLFFLHDPPEVPEEVSRCWPNLTEIVSGKSPAILSFFADQREKIGNIVKAVLWSEIFKTPYNRQKETVLKKYPHLQSDDEIVKEKAAEKTAQIIWRQLAPCLVDILILGQTLGMEKLLRIILSEKAAYLVLRFSLFYAGQEKDLRLYHFDIPKDFVSLYYVLSNKKLIAAVEERNWQKVAEAIKELNTLEHFKWQEIIPLGCP